MGEQQECGSRKIVERGKEINIFFLLNQKFISNVLLIFFCMYFLSRYVYKIGTGQVTYTIIFLNVTV
jgi:hypothetical protein